MEANHMRQVTDDLQRMAEGAGSVPGAATDRMSMASLVDLEAMRLLLHGSSVIDWHQLAFEDLSQVRRFLRVNEIDPDSVHDM